MIRAVHFHAIDGRIRLHIAQTKGSQARAREIEKRLGDCFGITGVKANPLTGNILITYDSRLSSEAGIRGELQKMGYPGWEENLAFNTALRRQSNSAWVFELVRFGLETLLTALIL